MKPIGWDFNTARVVDKKSKLQNSDSCMWHLAFMVNSRGSKCNVDVGNRILTNSKNGPTFSESFITTILLGKLRRSSHLLLLLSLQHYNSLQNHDDLFKSKQPVLHIYTRLQCWYIHTFHIPNGNIRKKKKKEKTKSIRWIERFNVIICQQVCLLNCHAKCSVFYFHLGTYLQIFITYSRKTI